MKFSSCCLALFLLPGLLAGGEVELTYEVFSLPMREAAKLRRAKLGGGKAYDWMVKGIEEKEVKQEQFTVVKSLGEASSVVEEVEEYIFPTEYAGSLNYFVGQGIGVLDRPVPLPTRPEVTAFDTKNLGLTLEVEARRFGDVFHVKICPTKVGLTSLDAFGRGISQVEMPRFSIQGLRSEFEVTLNKPALVGTVSPPKELQIAGEKRVWLAFVTLTQ